MAEGLVGSEGFAVDASLIVADTHRQRGVETPDQLDPKANRAVAEYFAALDNAAFGGAMPVAPKFISPTDPAARWTASWGGPAVYAYCTNYLIDVQHAVIVDVEPSTAVRQAEVTAAKTMIERTHDRFELWPERLIAELPELGSLDRRRIAALVGLAPWTRQSGQWRGKSLIGGGRKSVRSSLFIGAMVAARYNPQLKQFRDKLVSAGKPKLLALIAVARKLITILNAILRDRRPWQPLPA